MPRHSFTVDHATSLVMEPQGMTGAFAMMCALGVPRIDVPIEHAYERPEWVDIIAKIRGMEFGNTLYRFPVVRQHCGCRLCIDPAPADGRGTLAIVRVRLCVGHPWADHEGKAWDVIDIGRLVARDYGDSSHGQRRG